MFNSPLNISDDAVALVNRPTAPRSDFQPKGHFHVEHLDKEGNLLGAYDFPNGITDVGLNHILATEFVAGAAVTTWYIALIDNTSFTALANADTMASHAGWIENSGYSNTTRVAWTPGAPASRSTTNAVTDDFNINASGTIKGIFIVSDSAKGGTVGTLWSTAAFGSTVPVNNGDTLKITYSISG